MKIEKLKKLAGNRYKLSLDNKQELTLYEDVIINHQLLTGKIINEQLLSIINKENNYYDSYNLALKYINVRLRGEQELRNYLTKKDFELVVINDTINKLKKQGYLNDANFIKAFINDKLLMTNWGPLKIKNELEKLSLDDNIIDQYINEIDANILELRAKKIIDKMINLNKNLSSNMLKRKIEMFLYSIGYYQELFNKFLDDIKVDNSKLIKKEYDKLHKKYAHKYNEKDLKYILKQKLYQKGFDYNDLD